MTKEEIKANELIERFRVVNLNLEDLGYKKAKQSAIICVDEILKSRPTSPTVKNSDYDLSYFELVGKNRDFWESVKKILEGK